MRWLVLLLYILIMEKRWVDYCLVVIATACLFLYFLTNVPREHMYELTTPLDRIIPLIPFFVIPYTSLHYFLMPATLIVLFMQPTNYYLRVFLISAIVLLVSSNIVFFVFPTYFPFRPVVHDDSLLLWMIHWIYMMDRPGALFPSVHVNIALLCALMWWQVRSRFAWFIIGWAVLVVLSTLFIRQHYILDVIAGGLSAGIGHRVGEYVTKRLFSYQ